MQIRRMFRYSCLVAAVLVACPPARAQTDLDSQAASSGPIRLVNKPTRAAREELTATEATEADADRSFKSSLDSRETLPRSPSRPVLSEFEAYASSLSGGMDIRRLGSELMLGNRNPASIEVNRQVPPDYIVGVGDEIQVTAWGSIDADLRLTVDRAGRIVLPRVGPVVVAGVRLADLTDLLNRRVGQMFKNFQLSATLGRLRGIRYYVTGFTTRPGAYTVSSLATVMTGLIQAGGHQLQGACATSSCAGPAA